MAKNTEKPSYLALLNSIAVNERKGEIFLNAWADTTTDADLAAALRFVAIREGEHAGAFTKRMCELGYEVCEEEAFQVFADFDGLLSCVTGDYSDAEKIAYLNGLGGGGGSDPFKRFFDDTTIDPTTGALLGRYIAEERDSGRRLSAEYERVTCESSTEMEAPAKREQPAASAAAEFKALKASVKALKKEVKALRRKVA